MRTIGVVTVLRSDYGIYLPILRRMQEAPELRLHLIVAGAHLSLVHGETVRAIEADGFSIGDRVEMTLVSDTPEAIGISMGLGLIMFARSYARIRPDLLLVLGDRFEMHAAAMAALSFKIPVAHIHGGEETQGAFDNALRHSMTKLSHIHFVATEEAARRVIQMGEEPWRVTVTGAPSLDHLGDLRLLSREELERQIGFDLDPAPLLVTYHPVTLEYEQTAWQVQELLAGLEACGLPAIFTAPNTDTNSHTIREAIERFIGGHPRCRFIANLGTQAYFSLMRYAAAMVGNSSSGLIEAPSFELPVVNIGIRQQGRLRAANVLDVGYQRQEILAGIRQVLTPEFRERLRGMANPYGDGHAAERIVARLREAKLGEWLLVKRFHESAAALRAAAGQQIDVHVS